MYNTKNYYLLGALQLQFPLEQLQDKAPMLKAAVKDAGVILYLLNLIPTMYQV